MYVVLVISETSGPNDRHIDESVPVIDDSMLGVVVPLSQMVVRRASNFCSFLSGMVNCMLWVLRCTPSHSPSCFCGGLREGLDHYVGHLASKSE